MFLGCTDLRRVCLPPAAQVVLAALISLDAGPVRLRWLWGAFLVSIITGKSVWVSACTNNTRVSARARSDDGKVSAHACECARDDMRAYCHATGGRAASLQK